MRDSVNLIDALEILKEPLQEDAPRFRAALASSSARVAAGVFADEPGASAQPGCSLLPSNFLDKNLELFQRVEQTINR